jgi:hypothetical protein
MLLLSPAYAKSHHHHNNPQYHSSSGSSSTPVYLVGKETKIDEVRYPDCKDHYAVQETTTSLYSDGSKRVYSNSTVYNSDGSVLITDCRDVKHIMYDDNHYFIVSKQKNYEIIDDKAQPLTIRQYSKIQEVAPNRLLVKYNKRYGIIDLNEQTIVPIKYQKFDEISHNIFLTKLNKYYGIVDVNNRIIIDNDCDKIKPLFDTFVVKKADKYGLLDLNANTILNTEFDKIGKLGEYITVKKNGKYQVYDYAGRLLAPNQYKKLRLNRNHLQGYINRWVDVPVEVNLYK